MGDIDEPPPKVTKFQMDSQFLEGDVTDEGQEEWLSEGILTDDDYNPSQHEAEHGESNSQDESNANEHEEVSQGQMESSAETGAGNIEETLNNFEKSENNAKEEQDISDELETFLIRKSDGKHIGATPVSRDSRKQSEDDGNDTDDLLRVLGDGDQRDKDQVKKDGKDEEHDDDDDDDFIFEGSSITAKYQAAKSILMKAKATRAEPEEDITDCSSDEVTLTSVKKMYVMKPSAARSSTQMKTLRNPAASNSSDKKSDGSKIVKKVINVTHRPPQPTRTTQPTKQYVNKRLQNQSILKSNIMKKPTNTKEQIKEPKIYDDDHDDFDVGKKNADKDNVQVKQPQRLMRPEEMDEEVPSDIESASDEDSVYDELPSSDSDALDDWFSIDVRAERAGDYLPLLGDKAYQLLQEEKERVSTRIQSLKKSLSVLTSSGRAQADELRRATASVAELDAMLKAA